MVGGARRLIAAVGFALAAAAPPAQAERLAIGIAQAPVDLHPLYDNQLVKRYLFGFSLRALTQYDADWTLAAQIAESLPSFENGGAEAWTSPDGEDGVAMTFTIREGLSWGDGVPVTSADFQLTWTIGRHPDSGVPAFDFYERLEEVEALDDRRFVMRFDRVTYNYNSVGNFFPTPAHIEAARFDADPAGYRAASAYTTAPETPGLWNGPFIVETARAGAQYGLIPNPHWPGTAPGLKRVELRVIENSAALEANLLSGAVDMLAGEIGLRADQAAALEQRVGDRFDFRFVQSLFYEHLDLNHDNPGLADARVRRALSLAIDRAALSDQLFGGRATPAGSFMAGVDPMAIDDPALNYDPVAAKALLDDAGWRVGAGGVRRNPAGQTLSVPIVTTAGDQVRAVVQQAIQAWWRGVGVDAPIVTEPPRVLFGDTLRKRAFAGAAMFAWISAPEHLPKSTLHSTQIPTPENNFGGQNYMGWANAEADRLIDALEIERSADARRPLWAALQRLYRDETPAIPLYFRSYAFVLPKDLEGLTPRGHMDLSSFDAENWRRGPAADR